MRFAKQSRFVLRSVLAVAVIVSTSATNVGTAFAQQKQKSNVQRERCAQLATRQVNTPGGAYYAAPIRGGGGGGGIAGLIIGAVVITAIAASVAQSQRAKAENSCLVAAGLRPNAEPSSAAAAPEKPTRSSRTAPLAERTSERAAVGSGGGNSWIRRSIKSQQ
jgi:hypothetical protein